MASPSKLLRRNGQDSTDSQLFLRSEGMPHDSPDDLLPLQLTHVPELPRDSDRAVQPGSWHRLSLHLGFNAGGAEARCENALQSLLEGVNGFRYLSHVGFHSGGTRPEGSRAPRLAG
jgi:hypothetical protein